MVTFTMRHETIGLIDDVVLKTGRELTLVGLLDEREDLVPLPPRQNVG